MAFRWTCSGYNRYCRRKATIVGFGCALCQRCNEEMQETVAKIAERYAAKGDAEMVRKVTILARVNPYD